MSDIPEMMHKPRESNEAQETGSGGTEEAQSLGSTQVPLNFPYPTTGLDHKSLWTSENFWRMAPITASLFGGGPAGARQGAGAMWKVFQWLKGSRTQKPLAPGASKIPGYNGQPIDERLEMLLAEGQRHRVMALFERDLANRIGGGHAGKELEAAFSGHAKTLMPIGNFSKVIENPITHQAEKITISTTYAPDGVYMIVSGDRGSLIRQFDLASLGSPLKREVELLTNYFRSEFKAPPVRAALPVNQGVASSAARGSTTGEASTAHAVGELQHGESSISIWSPLTKRAEAIECSWQIGSNSILARAIGPENREILEILPLSLSGKVDQIENALMHSYMMRYFAGH